MLHPYFPRPLEMLQEERWRPDWPMLVPLEGRRKDEQLSMRQKPVLGWRRLSLMECQSSVQTLQF